MTKACRLWFWLAPLLGAAALASALGATADSGAPPADPPAGQLLIASATIQDPRFYHSVILLLHHDRSGAFGIIINRPLGERPLAALLGKADGKSGNGGADAGLKGSIRVFFGGPVQPEFGFLVHSTDFHRSATLAVGEGLAMTATRDVLRAIARHRGPAKYLFALGYSGWGAGQLEAEIAHHDWFTELAEPGQVFDADRGTLWQKALADRSREL